MLGLDSLFSSLPVNCYPRLAKISPDEWECHLGFGNRKIGITVRAATAEKAIAKALMEMGE